MHNAKLRSTGGRVLCATALGTDVTQAQQKAYALCAQIEAPDLFYRLDIAYRAIEREALK